MRIRRKRMHVGATLLMATVLVAACGGPSPTDTLQTTPTGNSPTGSTDTGQTDTSQPAESNEPALEVVYAAVEGLTGQERYDKLLELAQAEPGPIGFYHSGNYEAMVEAFQERTGLSIDDYSATSERVAERVVNEKSADQTGSDVLILSAEDMTALERAGGVAVPLVSPTSEGLAEGLVGDGWVTPIFTMDMPVYNTSLLDVEDLPTTWNELLTEFEGTLALEATAWKWYGDFVEDYLMAVEGLSLEEAIEFVTNGYRGAKLVDGNSLTVNLLASGEYSYVANAFPQNVPGLQERGAPIDFAPYQETMPVFYHNVPLGLSSGGKNPAGGLLFLEFFMSEEGQNIIAGTNYGPASSLYQGETLLSKYPNAIFMDMPLQPVEEQEQWKERFDILLREIGGTVSTD